MCFVGICCALTLAESHGLELWKETSLPQTSTIRADWSTAGEKHRGKCMINTFKSFMLNSIISVIHHSHLYWDYAANIRMLWPEHTHTHSVFSAVVTSCWTIRLIMVMWRMELRVVRQWCVWTGSVSLFSIWTWAPVPPDPTDTSVPVMGWEHSWLHRFTQ